MLNEWPMMPRKKIIGHQHRTNIWRFHWKKLTAVSILLVLDDSMFRENTKTDVKTTFFSFYESHFFSMGYASTLISAFVHECSCFVLTSNIIFFKMLTGYINYAPFDMVFIEHNATNLFCKYIMSICKTKI